jgi:carbon-monoxide dehydrogenase small subunit
MSRQFIKLIVNGDPYEVAVEPRTTLIEVLRDELGLTGTKRGCTSGSCGVCTVNGEAGEPILSCLTLAVECDGRRVTTIEGIAEPGRLHAVQQAFWELGAVQCGYCTPGLVMTVRALLAENPGADAEAINEALAGALCRCTGHIKVKLAVAHAVATMAAQPAEAAETPKRETDGTPA